MKLIEAETEIKWKAFWEFIKNSVLFKEKSEPILGIISQQM